MCSQRRFNPLPVLLFLLSLLLVQSACVRQRTSPPASENRPLTPLPPLANSSEESPSAPSGDLATVTHVYDGDTIEVELDNQTYRLRLIGIDAPERDEPFYEDAFALTQSLLEDNPAILVRDVSETDQYGRLLRYVYLEDGTFVNGELMRQGLARLVTFPPDVAQTEYLRVLQQEAQAAGIGMWSRPDLVGPCDCDRNLYDCRDFQSRSEAQTCFDYCWERTGSDIHNLDGGGDGLVCEFLP